MVHRLLPSIDWNVSIKEQIKLHVSLNKQKKASQEKAITGGSPFQFLWLSCLCVYVFACVITWPPRAEFSFGCFVFVVCTRRTERQTEETDKHTDRLCTFIHIYINICIYIYLYKYKTQQSTRTSKETHDACLPRIIHWTELLMA